MNYRTPILDYAAANPIPVYVPPGPPPVVTPVDAMLTEAGEQILTEAGDAVYVDE